MITDENTYYKGKLEKQIFFFVINHFKTESLNIKFSQIWFVFQNFCSTCFSCGVTIPALWSVVTKTPGPSPTFPSSGSRPSTWQGGTAGAGPSITTSETSTALSSPGRSHCLRQQCCLIGLFQDMSKHRLNNYLLSMRFFSTDWQYYGKLYILSPFCVDLIIHLNYWNIFWSNATLFRRSEYHRRNNLDIICNAIKRISDLSIAVNKRDDIVIDDLHKVRSVLATESEN